MMCPTFYSVKFVLRAGARMPAGACLLCPIFYSVDFVLWAGARLPAGACLLTCADEYHHLFAVGFFERASERGDFLKSHII